MKKYRVFFYFMPATALVSALIAKFAFVNAGCANSSKLTGGGKSKTIGVLIVVGGLGESYINNR